MQAISLALGNRERDNRNSMVGAIVLRSQALARGKSQWSISILTKQAVDSVGPDAVAAGVETIIRAALALLFSEK